MLLVNHTLQNSADEQYLEGTTARRCADFSLLEPVRVRPPYCSHCICESACPVKCSLVMADRCDFVVQGAIHRPCGLSRFCGAWLWLRDGVSPAPCLCHVIESPALAIARILGAISNRFLVLTSAPGCVTHWQTMTEVKAKEDLSRMEVRSLMLRPIHSILASCCAGRVRRQDDRRAQEDGRSHRRHARPRH